MYGGIIQIYVFVMLLMYLILYKYLELILRFPKNDTISGINKVNIFCKVVYIWIGFMKYVDLDSNVTKTA